MSKSEAKKEIIESHLGELKEMLINSLKGLKRFMIIEETQVDEKLRILIQTFDNRKSFGDLVRTDFR